MSVEILFFTTNNVAPSTHIKIKTEEMHCGKTLISFLSMNNEMMCLTALAYMKL